MKFFGIKKHNEPVNIDKQRPRNVDIVKKIIAEQQYRVQQDIGEWRRALRNAEDVYHPDRTELIRTFKDIDLDGHITGITESIKNKIKSKKFAIYKGDEIDEEATDKFNNEWFFDYIDSWVEAYFWGYSLVGLKNIENDTFTGIEKVPREYVIPEKKYVKKNLHVSSIVENEGIFFENPPYNDWYIFMWPSEGMGLYNKIAVHAIAKKNLLISAWKNAELFGSPFRMAKTDINDIERRKNAEYMLKNMGQAGYAVVDEDDNIDIISQSSSDAYRVFIEPYNTSNKEISKCLAGQTGMFDEKAFVGAANIHSELFDSHIMAIMRDLKFNINTELRKRMVKFGILSNDHDFRWVFEENIPVEKRAELIAKLSPYYQFSTEFIKNYLNLEGDVFQELPKDDMQQQLKFEGSIIDQVNKLYNYE